MECNLTFVLITDDDDIQPAKEKYSFITEKLSLSLKTFILTEQTEFTSYLQKLIDKRYLKQSTGVVYYFLLKKSKILDSRYQQAISKLLKYSPKDCVVMVIFDGQQALKQSEMLQLQELVSKTKFKSLFSIVDIKDRNSKRKVSPTMAINQFFDNVEHQLSHFS